MENIFKENFNLRNYTTIKVGGTTQYFAEPNNVNEFINLVEWAYKHKRRCRIIGAGSNLLINDIFLEGLIICTKKMRNIKIEPNRPGDPAYLVADINKVKQILDWVPTQSSIDNVVATAVKWYNKTHKKEMQ